ILAALRDRPGEEARPHLEAVLRDRKQSAANRLLAASLFLQGLDATAAQKLVTIAEAVEDGPVLAQLLRSIGPRTLTAGAPLLLAKVGSPAADVRAAAVGALAELAPRDAHEAVRKLLDDPNALVRSAAALACGKIGLKSEADALLKLARDS